MGGFDTLIYEKSDGVAYITLNRPKALNAYNVQMRDDLFQVLKAVKDDGEVRVVILKGAGEKAFCAGADLSDFLSAPPPVAARQIRWGRDVWGLFLSVPQPVIAALHGYVLGSGVEMALCCDIRIAADDARFGLPEVKLGIIPAAGGSQTLPRAIGQGLALDMLLTDRWIDADEACRFDLVNKVVEKEKLFSTVEKVARKIASYSSHAVQCAKQAVLRGLDMTLAEGIDLEKRLASLVVSADIKG
jgi:enoyl-CoA hydratase